MVKNAATLEKEVELLTDGLKRIAEASPTTAASTLRVMAQMTLQTVAANAK